MNISNLLKPNPITLKVNDDIDKALKLMDEFDLNGMPVIDDNESLVGMVVKADIYRFMVTPGHYEDCPVEWVMSKLIISAQSNEDLIVVAKRLRKNNIISMPVVENEKLVGTITIEDLLDYYIGLE
ncbi:CBS domain-containing protein [Clostridium folliculivorans]|uniref:CBS domain-containing protein n=1 Tax=Clostridium folliculivorans TaxID=2886038 RepID=A0A9W5Y377_9CLOT|nr:CBS domain-containing protein [Clostridium folliculivorans]GKU25759.1 CBS domain-containing protein [Clostridium folliculivorans]GKU28780.1 CBS domain-containing protein [Clostridium folliculivorans]